MTVEHNIAARKAAETVFELAVEQSRELPEQSVVAYWCRLLLLVEQVLPSDIRIPRIGPQVPQTPPPMSEDEAKAFEKHSMPWGKYNGTKIADVPMDYLLYIDDQKDEFRDRLHRYLASDRVQREQEVSDE